MSDNRNLSENFYRSRLTSISLSILLFAFSVGRGDITPSIFGVTISGFHRPFLLFSLFIGAAVSTFSLWLSYVNEARSVLAERSNLITLSDIPRHTHDAIDQIRNRVEAAIAVRQRFLEDPTVQRVIESGGAIPDMAYLKEITSAAWSENSAEILEDHIRAQILASPRPDLAEEVSPYLNYPISTHIERARGAYLASIEIYQLEAMMAGEMINAATQAGNFPNLDISASLDRVAAALKHHRKVVRNAVIRETVEITFVGLFVPLLLFAVAALHAVGAFHNFGLPSLPDVVEHLAVR